MATDPLVSIYTNKGLFFSQTKSIDELHNGLWIDLLQGSNNVSLRQSLQFDLILQMRLNLKLNQIYQNERVDDNRGSIILRLCFVWEVVYSRLNHINFLKDFP